MSGLYVVDCFDEVVDDAPWPIAFATSLERAERYVNEYVPLMPGKQKSEAVVSRVPADRPEDALLAVRVTARYGGLLNEAVLSIRRETLLDDGTPTPGPPPDQAPEHAWLGRRCTSDRVVPGGGDLQDRSRQRRVWTVLLVHHGWVLLCRPGRSQAGPCSHQWAHHTDVEFVDAP